MSMMSMEGVMNWRHCPNGDCISSAIKRPLGVYRNQDGPRKGKFQMHCELCGWAGPVADTYLGAYRAARPELDAGDLVRAL
jgi:hypothetical protein